MGKIYAIKIQPSCGSCKYSRSIHEDDWNRKLLCVNVPAISTGHPFPYVENEDYCVAYLPLDKTLLSCSSCYHSAKRNLVMECRLHPVAVAKQPSDWCSQILFHDVVD